jgi:DNA-binding PadR family transcriptional regulator
MGSGLASFGRFERPAKQVIQVLAAGPRTPARIRGEVGARCGDDLGPGSLFGTIARLERHALIEVVAAPDAPRAYHLTALGAETLEVQLAALARTPTASSAAPRATTQAGRSPA